MEIFVRNKIFFNYSKELSSLVLKRHGHVLRGKNPGVARSLAQRMEELKNEDVKPKINIGYPQLPESRCERSRERLNWLKKQRDNGDLEKMARKNELNIDLTDVKKDWAASNGPYHIRKLADHYGIYEHLFSGGYFIPRVPLNVSFPSKDDVVRPVYYGNIIKPSEAASEPEVSFDSSYFSQFKDTSKETYWTLLLTNPDGHLEQENAELAHWFIGNITGNDVKKGETIIPYLQPIPPKGTGYHRYIFVLYKQDKKIDFSSYKVSNPHDLTKRTFKTRDFYVANQDHLTPAGLSFFQSDWDSQQTNFFHTVLKVEEQIYEYDFPKPYIKDQKWFPLREPFNLYMDKYRDEKQVAKEYLERKLSKTHPFDGPEKPLQFPNAHPLKDIPSWLKTEKRKERLKMGRINDFL